MINKVEIARAFAIAAHEAVGQKRKYSGEPYWTHPEAVARIVEEAGGDDDMVAAAWLHDVVEDTKVTNQVIWDVFGSRVANYVAGLTKADYLEGTNRAHRSAAECARLANESYEVQTIKVADLIHNTESIVNEDPSFARVYMREKRDLLLVLTNARPILRLRAHDQLAAYFAKEGAHDQLAG